MNKKILVLVLVILAITVSVQYFFGVRAVNTAEECPKWKCINGNQTSYECQYSTPPGNCTVIGYCTKWCAD